MTGLPSLRALDRSQATRIWLAVEATDMRCGFDRLAERVRAVLGQDPLSDSLFIFRSRRGDRLKILMWDQVRASHVVATDDTIMPMLSKEKCAKARMWVYVGDAAHPYNVFDGFNRLASAGETSGGTSIWSESFGYDDFGNRWVPSASGLSLSPLTGTAASNYNGNNQMVANGDFSYDAAGNQTLMSPYSVTSDGENRQTGITSAENGSAAYTYDGDGRRVTKTVGGATTVYVYDAAGELAAEYSGQSEGAPCLTCYLTTGALGSVRLVTDESGNVVSRHDFLPFGEELATANRTAALGYGAVDGVSQRFTGQLRDAETSLDWFRTRYFSGPEGRFVSPDRPLVGQEAANPQSWNLYSYVMGSPLVFTDPDGQDVVPCPAGDPNTFCVDTNGSTVSDITPANGLPAGWLSGLADFWSITDPGKWLMAVEAQLPPQPPQPAPNNGSQSKPIDWKKVGSCLVDSTLNHYGLTAAAGASGALAIPISKSLVPPCRTIGEPTTNLLSVLGHYVEINVPRITIDGLASTNLLRIAGRANPYVAGALFAIDAGMITYDTYQCYQKQ
jgi:RHS repeat-associated protein